MEGIVGAILLKDVQGAKCDIGAKSAIKKLIGSATQSPVDVLCGELLLENDGDYYNYVLSRDSNILMFCDGNDTAPLNPEEFLLLEAIKKPCDRITAFRRLEWGVGLKIGSAVSVTVPGDNLSVDKRARATVHYRGTIGNSPGIHFGVEIMTVSLDLYNYVLMIIISISNQRTYRNSAVGTTDGSFQGKRYFTCQDGCGLFLPLHLVYPTEEAFQSQSKITSESLRSDKRLKPTYAHAATKGSSSQHSHIEECAVYPPSPLHKIGERVAFYNKKGVKHYGVVDWTGRETKTSKFPYVVIGIITVSIL